MHRILRPSRREFLKCAAAGLAVAGRACARDALPPREALATVAPEAVVEHSATEFTAKTAAEGKKARFTIELLLPSRAAAEAFVRSFADAGAASEAADHLAGLVSGARRVSRGK